MRSLPGAFKKINSKVTCKITKFHKLYFYWHIELEKEASFLEYVKTKILNYTLKNVTVEKIFFKENNDCCSRIQTIISH